MTATFLVALGVLVSPLHAQLRWTAYDNTGALVGTQNQAATFDPGSGTYTFSVPAGGRMVFVTTNFVPIAMEVPTAGTSLQTISYKMKSSAGWTNAITGNRVNQLGLFSDGGTPPGAAGNFADDNGLFANFKGGTWGNEVFGGTTTIAGLLDGYQSALKLGSGKSAGSVGAWTLADDSFVNITFRVALTSSGAFSLGTSSSYANAGLVIEDSSAVGAGTSYQAIYSAAATAVTAPKTFNEFAFYFRNDAAAAATITMTDVVGLTSPPYFAAVTGQPPATLTGSVGDTLSITSTAVGSAVIYQWEKSTDGGATFVPINAGANGSAATATLVLTSVQTSDEGQYHVIIGNAAGSTTSAACTVAVTAGAVAPSVQTDPQAATILVGASNTFAVSASGTAPLAYQWQKSVDAGAHWADLTNAVDATLVVGPAQLSDAGSYRVTVTNSVGAATSAAAELTVNQVPSFTLQPVGGNLQAGQSLTLTAAATVGTPVPTYQWKLNNVVLNGATSASYTIASATGAATGNYTVVATNAAGSATSATAAVNVLSTALATTNTAPANNASAVFPDQPLTITFNAPITAGVSGSLKIFDSANPSTPVDTISFDAAAARVANASILALPVQTKTVGGQTGLRYYPVTIDGNTLTVYPRDGTLTYGKTYYVTIDAGTIVDASGATFVGFSDNTTWRFSTKAAAPDAGSTRLTVAHDGSGDFYTVQGALDFIPANNTTPTTIYIKNGIYYEIVSWTAKSNITFLGQSRDGVVIGYPNNNNFNPTGTAWRAAFTCRGGNSTGMVITNLTIKNFTPKTGSQAEALYLSGSATALQAVITHVNLSSYQDTLLINGQAYISDSYIEGDTDFMWGNGPVYFTNCELKALSIQSYYTQIRNPATNHGFVYVDCKFSSADADSQNPANPVSGCYLGRLDQNANPHTEVVLINSTEGDHILPVAWNLNGQTVSGAAATNCVEFNPRKISDNSPVDVSQRAAWSYQWTSPANDAQVANYNDPVWVLNTSLAGDVMSAWTPALAPLVLSAPVSVTTQAGGGATFGVTVAALPAATYQWNKDGSPIDGATAATLSIGSPTSADGGSYTVTATNSHGSVTSAAAVLTVMPAGTPPDVPQTLGSTNVTGTGFTANWAAVSEATGYRLDVSTSSDFSSFVAGYNDLDVGTNLSRAISGLTAGTNYYYRVRAINAAGTSASSTAATIATSAAAADIVIVNTGATADRTYSLGGTAYTQNFDTLPSSGTFAWVNDSTLPGWHAVPTTGSLNATGVTNDGSSNLADLTLGSIGTAGNADRALAYHTRLNTAPTYLGLAFTNQSGRVLDSFTLTYTPEQWRENTTGRDMTFTVEYRIGATSTDLNATSGWTTLSDLAFTSASGSVGKTATLTSGPVAVTVADGATIWFRWKTANSATSSTTSNDTIAIDNVSVSMTAVADGSPVITTQPAAQTVDLGSAVTFTVAASGDAPFTYQWSKDGSPLSGETSAALTIASAQDTSAGDYTVVVTNGKGSVTSAPATLTISTVVNAPQVVTQPQSQTVDSGATVTFTITATGTAPLSYQWRKNGTAIADEISDTLTLNNVQPADAGAYTVVVSNSAGSDTSAVASLDLTGVVTPPVVLAQSGSQSVVIGGAVSFSVTAGGSAPFTYQWRKDNADIPDATAPTLTLTNVQLTAAGNYTVVVTNAASSVTSDPVALTVTEPPAVGEGSIFVAPDGLVDNPGTFAQPTTLANAIALVPAGGTIFVRGGTYAMSTELRIERGNNGTDGALKNLVAYVPPGGTAETPVFDFSSQPYGNPSTVSNPRGVWLGGDYWHLKGLEIKNAADNGVYVVGNHNIVELCRLHGNRDTGLQIGRYSSSAPRSEWPTYNLILNCESYDNCDVAPGSGENADGFACKLTAGAGNVFRGCISHNNIDDGWDLYTKSETGPIDPVVLDQCISYNNGTLTDGTQNAAGDRNGFKLGGEKIAVAHYVSRCISFNNGKNGFTWNSNPGAIVLVNNLAWDNVEGNFKFDSGEATFYNNISLWTTSSGPGNRNGVNDRYVGNSGVPTGASNIFWFVGSSSRGPSINDASLTAYKTAFVTLTVPVGGFARNADGSIALGDFARPVANSPLLNAGVLPPGDVIGQFPFATAGYYEDAPDIGAVETYLHTPPVIVTAPQGQSVITGAAVTLSVSVQGTAPFTYQWSKDGSAIGGATNSSFALAAAQVADSGSYTITITNSAGHTTSDAVTVTVGAATGPSVTTQPAAQSVYVGGSATFSVVVSGTAPFTFQWKKDGSPISGATGGAYTVANAQSSDAGGYTVVVTNSIDSVTSDVATLTVTDSPEAPVAAAATAVSNTGFVASWSAVSGGTSYRLDVSSSSNFDTFVSGYQDLAVGSDLSRALTGLSSGTAYYYRVRAVHAAGTSGSSNVISVVTAGAATTTLDASQLTWFKTRTADTLTTGVNSITFNEGQASASSFVTYLPNAINLAVGQKLTLTLVFQMGSNVAVAPNALRFGLFNANGTRVTASANTETNSVVTDDMGYVASYNIDSGAGKLLARIPGSTNTTLMGSTGATLYTDLVAANPSGTTAAFTASTTYTLTYVVARLSESSELTATLTGGGLSNYVLTGTDTTTDSRANGTYDQLAVRIAGGSNSFNALTITGLSYSIEAAGPSAPSIDTQPASVAGALGGSAAFTVVASGTNPLTYQWQKDNVAISGATSATLALTNLTSGDAGSYTVVVTNDLGSATSAAAVLTVTVATPPVFTTQPQSTSVTEGANVTFTAAATGTDPLTYQWKKNGSAISGATSATLTLSTVQLADAGDYVLTATNSASVVDSAVATLTVQVAPPQMPVITAQPLAQTVAAGTNATFTVTATGTAPLTYQWKKDGNTLAGATTSSLTVSNVQAGDTGNYAVTVSNAAGSVISDAVALNLASALPVTEFNLTGFATVGSGTTGGGVIPESDPAYRKVTTAQEFVQAISDSNKTAGKVKVIEIMNDLNLGWIEVGATVQGLPSNPLRSHATPKLHPALIASGVSVLDIKAKSPLTIFSATGVTIKHVNFNVKGTSNIIIRNLKFDEMWEWDEASKGNYDSNDWDFITVSNGGDVSNIWIDHCTFTKAYDGIVDLKAGTTNATLSWCKYIGDDEATNPNSPVRVQLAALEAKRSSYPFYNFLRTNGYSVDDIATIIQGHDKGHLMGSNSLKAENDSLTATFHHQWFKNVWDRVVPRLRGGNVHDYNIYVDDVELLAAKRLRDARAASLSSALLNTLNNTYSFNPPINGTISTENGSILVEKSIYADCLWPLRNNQTDPSSAIYTGKIKALDSIYSFHAPDGTLTTVRGNSTDANNPMGPFQAPVIPFVWDLPNNQLPYDYTMDDPAQLPAILAAGSGAGTLTWSKDNWLKTAYTVDTSGAPTITAQPQSQTVATGADATFTVQVTSGTTATYQWKKDGTALSDSAHISGSTTAVLTISATTLADIGTYSVVVANTGGNITSNGAALTVIAATAPSITTQPQSQSVAIGSDVEFAVVAAGTGPFTYQWKHDGADVVGATGPILDLANVQAGDAGNYTVVVTNTVSAITSSAAVLTVNLPPAAPVASAATSVTVAGFTAHWNSAPTATGYRLDVSTNDSFTNLVAGYADLDVGAALNASVTGLSASTTYYYRIRATNAAGTSGASATITVVTSDVPPTPVTPTLTWATPAAIGYGTALSATQLNATADVAGAFVYTPASGAVLAAGSQTLSVTFTPTDLVHYTNATATVSLTVNKATPAITWSAPAAITAGTALGATQLNASANVAGAFVYTPPAGTVLGAGVGQTLSVAFTPTDSANYKNATATTTLTVNPLIIAPAIATAPVGQSVSVGDAASFSVVASGTGPFTYQWRKDGVAIAGATSATLAFTSTAVTDAGSYSVVVTNAAGSVTSDSVSLTATVPSFTGIYFGQFTAGGDWALSVNADNTGVFIANLPQRQSVIVLDVTLAADGSFTVTGSEIRATGTATPTVAIAGTHAPQALVSGQFTLTGHVVHQSVVGQLEGLDETFSGAADPSTGAAQGVAGYYAAAALGTSDGGVYTVIGASGQALVVTTTPGSVGGGTGTIDANGQLTVATANSSAITVSVAPESESVTASVLPVGATTPISFAGLSGSAISTSRIVNLSVRSGAGKLDQTLIMGFVVAGSGSQDVLVRGIGPGLVPYGVPAATVLADPQIRLFDNGSATQIAENDDWGGTAPLVVKTAEVGAFVIPSNSKDAVLLAPLTAGAYSGHITTTGTAAGLALLEVYDATLVGDAHFVNVSVRSEAKTGDGILIAGFVITGNAPKKLLIRGVGPSLVTYGVSASSVLQDPMLTVYQGSTVVATNDNWGGTTALKDVAQSVGAFALDSDTTKDAAAVVTLQPGVYTVHVAGVNNTSGVALLEIYDVNP
ncbi:immunoglobulin domain-containing protein [Horticoccus luteus]|uniref:Immunoglobulin domain-containing protein n=1 Tax=Horticoccus luteus TaxID=2862869 RepID=A0A8F9TT37_9BACT|nr:pectinesterase family protein [Horticoccus luteus]QYM77803.1 immunoglobulin domain-containing protein [Horticoccus luteus]